ncbi:MAG TPA: hypothetical protein VN717_08640 [Gemmatimonadaceae bacterium]|nr:hypothetical protein [Gemmatimonadaceae bacterium]
MSDNTGWKALCAILLLPFIVAVRGWAFVMLWRWFIVPFGVTAITFWWAYGLALIVGMFRSTKAEDEKKDIGELVIKSLADMLAVVAIVGMAWLAHRFGMPA